MTPRWFVCVAIYVETKSQWTNALPAWKGSYEEFFSAFHFAKVKIFSYSRFIKVYILMQLCTLKERICVLQWLHVHACKINLDNIQWFAILSFIIYSTTNPMCVITIRGGHRKWGLPWTSAFSSTIFAWSFRLPYFFLLLFFNLFSPLPKV